MYKLYFMRIPKYKKVTIEETKLIQKYLMGKRLNDSENEKALQKHMPSFNTLMYYKEIFDRNKLDIDNHLDKPGYKCLGIFEQLGRFSKASQFSNWFSENIEACKWPYELCDIKVSRIQLEALLDVCNNVRKYGIRCLKREPEHYGEGFEVNEEICSSILPIFKKEDDLWYPYEYTDMYAKQVIEMINLLNKILTTTNFDKEDIYISFNAFYI